MAMVKSVDGALQNDPLLYIDIYYNIMYTYTYY